VVRDDGDAGAEAPLPELVESEDLPNNDPPVQP